jgi:signal transduction histidine kinase
MGPSKSPTQTIEAIPLRREAADVGVLLELATDGVQSQARRLGVTLTIRVATSVPETLHFDRIKVAWAVTNLVGTALRHVASSGGTIDVSVGYDQVRSMLSIAVQDNGAGIPPDRRRRLLDRVKWYPGSAMALLLVEDIALAHGGRLHVESRCGRADHFTNVLFTIPAD